MGGFISSTGTESPSRRVDKDIWAIGVQGSQHTSESECGRTLVSRAESALETVNSHAAAKRPNAQQERRLQGVVQLCSSILWSVVAVVGSSKTASGTPVIEPFFDLWRWRVNKTPRRGRGSETQITMTAPDRFGRLCSQVLGERTHYLETVYLFQQKRRDVPRQSLPRYQR